MPREGHIPHTNLNKTRHTTLPEREKKRFLTRVHKQTNKQTNMVTQLRGAVHTLQDYLLKET